MQVESFFIRRDFLAVWIALAGSSDARFRVKGGMVVSNAYDALLAAVLLLVVVHAPLTNDIRVDKIQRKRGGAAR